MRNFLEKKILTKVWYLNFYFVITCWTEGMHTHQENNPILLLHNQILSNSFFNRQNLYRMLVFRFKCFFFSFIKETLVSHHSLLWQQFSIYLSCVKKNYFFLTLSHTNTQTLWHAHTYTISLCLTQTHTHTHTHTLSLSLSLSDTHTQHTNTHSLSLWHTHTCAR